VINTKKIVQVVEGTCRWCRTQWTIEFFLGEEVWELRNCPTCWKGLEVQVRRVADDDKAKCPTLLDKFGVPL